ncbi:MAG TPA: DUF1127 domain-containing protein [Arenibaculum sp.]|nr:DUF1127 domain-containing protein [Arenibaculum sp.]
MTTVVHPTGIAGRGAGFSLGEALRSAVDTIILWHERASSRRKLADLDPRMLRDIGLEETAVLAEIRKPFWRA